MMQVSDWLVTTQHHLAPLGLCKLFFAMGWGFRFEDASGAGEGGFCMMYWLITNL